MRKAVFQGSFYGKTRQELEKQLIAFFKGIKKSGNAIAVISPHAGFAYSGLTAAKAIAKLKESPNFVILSPNHSGIGSAISVNSEKEWENCLGRLQVNEKIAESIVERTQNAELDEIAHLQEHSIEVQLPFLQFLFKNFQIVPVTIAEHNLEALQELGKVLFELSKKFEFGLIASSDFTHFESAESAKRKDKQAIERILALDVEGFHKLVLEKQLSICGFPAITALLEFARLKKLKAKLIEYSNSARTTMDENSVVGYAGIAFE